MTSKSGDVLVGLEGWRYAQNAYKYASRKKRLWHQARSFFYASANPFFARKWFEILQEPDYWQILKNRPRFYLRPFRAYISTKWNKEKRLKVISDTYRFIFGNGETFKQVIFQCEEKEMLLSSFTLKDGAMGELSLGYDERFRKEGELTIFLRCDKVGGLVATTSFAFEEQAAGKWVCWIGCIQGWRERTDEDMKELQKLMHGLRPKALMVIAVQEFVRQLGIDAIFGAGNHIQAFNGKHAIHIPGIHKINFDYNTMWIESGGESVKGGWFLLPLKPNRKSLDDIKVHKRAYYKRRYTMIDEISENMCRSVLLLKGEKNLSVCLDAV